MRRAGLALALATLLAATGCATTRGPTPAATPTSTERLPSLVLPDLDGRARGLDEFTGQVVLLDFWATWCVPCLESLPVYAELQAELGPRGLQVVAINVDDDSEPVADFAGRFAPGVLVLLDPEATTPPKLGLKVMPTAWVLDRDGLVRSKREGFHRDEVEGLRAELLEMLGDAPGSPAPEQPLPEAPPEQPSPE